MAKIRVLHLSDIHLGTRDKDGGIIPHLTAHDLRALEAFQNVLRVISGDGITTGVVFSGDATARGTQEQFETYQEFRDTGLSVDPTLPAVALGAGSAWILDIPGNHDYFGGFPLHLVPIRKVRGKHFDENDWNQKLDTDRFSVRFFGICSTSGCSRTQQWNAMGEYVDADVIRLAQRIDSEANQAAGESRKLFPIVVTHHSPEHRPADTHGMSRPALDHLRNLCSRSRNPVKGILTGHVHRFDVVPRKGGIAPEVRSATTLQSNALRQNQRRGFVIHEFEDAGANLAWTATEWRFTGTRFLKQHSRAVN